MGVDDRAFLKNERACMRVCWRDAAMAAAGASRPGARD